MYCLKCGRPVEGATLCAQCAAEEYAKQQQYNNYYANCNYPEPHNRMYGFGKALTSTILSNIGFVFAYLALIYAVTVYLADIGIVFFMISLPLVIVPLILGISSINTFKRRKAPCVKPIATLILGIVGLSTAALSAFFDLFALLVFLSI